MFKSSKTKKSQNAQKSETIKLILKNLSNQYSLKEVIDCVFSSPSKNKELKTIMEFLLKEEGKLKIIQYLLHIEDSANNIEENTDFQDMDDSLENINSIRPRLRKRKIPTVYSVSSSKSSNKSEECGPLQNHRRNRIRMYMFCLQEAKDVSLQVPVCRHFQP